MKHTSNAPKRRIRMLPAAALMALLFFPVGAPQAKAAAFDAHYTSASLQAQEQEAGNLLNNDRGRYNLPALAIDPELSRIARIKSQDMLSGGYFSAHLADLRRRPRYADPFRLQLYRREREHRPAQHRGKGAGGVPLLPGPPAQRALLHLHEGGHRRRRRGSRRRCCRRSRRSFCRDSRRFRCGRRRRGRRGHHLRKSGREARQQRIPLRGKQEPSRRREHSKQQHSHQNSDQAAALLLPPALFARGRAGGANIILPIFVVIIIIIQPSLR